MRDTILIKGAKEHNLQNIDVELPRDRLVVITGLSGSGKSSLAFDTLYAEGQRRFLESLVDTFVIRRGLEKQLRASVANALLAGEGVLQIRLVALGAGGSALPSPI